jgi:hypothetical protein
MATYTDYNGNVCDDSVVESTVFGPRCPCTDPNACVSNPVQNIQCGYDIGYGCFILYKDCKGSWYGDQDGQYEIVTDPNNNQCDIGSLNDFGYCCGNVIPDSFGGFCENDCTTHYPHCCFTGDNGICQDQYSLGAYCYPVQDNNGTYCPESDLDALRYCFGTCNDSSACGEDGNGCLYPNPYTNNSCELFSPALCKDTATDNYLNGDPLSPCVYQYDCAGNIISGDLSNNAPCYDSVKDALGYCCGTCNDSYACGEDSNGCLYDNNCGCGNPAPSVGTPDCNLCNCNSDECYNFGCGCGNSGSPGCNILGSCNYSQGAGCDDGSCTHPIDQYHDCSGNCTYDNGCGCGVDAHVDTDGCGNYCCSNVMITNDGPCWRCPGQYCSPDCTGQCGGSCNSCDNFGTCCSTGTDLEGYCCYVYTNDSCVNGCCISDLINGDGGCTYCLGHTCEPDNYGYCGGSCYYSDAQVCGEDSYGCLYINSYTGSCEHTDFIDNNGFRCNSYDPKDCEGYCLYNHGPAVSQNFVNFANDYFGNCCANSSLDTDTLNNSLCDGYGPYCTDATACGEDINGCFYKACNGNCTHRTPTLWPNCPQPSIQPSVLVSYKVGALPVPKNPNDPALKNVLLAQNTNFPLILHATVSAAPTFGSSGFQWMTMTSIDTNNAAGIGQNNITISITQDGGGMFDSNGCYRADIFPVEYGIPLESRKTIANTNAGIFTATFSQPIKDPLIAFSSVGNPSTYVPVSASSPFTPIWALTGYTTYQNPVNATQYTQFTGNEGYNIIRLDGVVSSISFNYTTNEYYCNVLFGFVNQNR